MSLCEEAPHENKLTWKKRSCISLAEFGASKHLTRLDKPYSGVHFLEERSSSFVHSLVPQFSGVKTLQESQEGQDDSTSLIPPAIRVL